MSYTFLQEQGAESSAESFSDIPAYVLSRLNLTAGKSCSNGSATESCPSSQSGMMREHSMGDRGEEKLMSYAEDSRARTSAPQTSKQSESTANAADYGEKWQEWLAKYNPITCSWKTRQLLLFEDSDESWEIWPQWGTIRDGMCFQPQKRERQSYDDESLYWPSPNASEWRDIAKAKTLSDLALREKFGASGRIGRTICKLSPQLHSSLEVVGLNPCFAEMLMGWPIGKTALNPLATAKFQQWLDSHGVASHPQTVESNTDSSKPK